MDFGSRAMIAADGVALAATAIAVHLTSSPTIDALMNAVTGGRANNRSLTNDLLDGIMRFVSTHVPTLADLEPHEAKLLQNSMILSASRNQDDVQRAADGIIADAVTKPSQAILAAADAGVKSVLGDLPVTQVIQDAMASRVTAFGEDVASRFKTHMVHGDNGQASQKMLKAVVDQHSWTSLDKLAAKLIDTATDGSAIAGKAALFGYGIVKRALDDSVVQNPLYATQDGAALQIGGTLFSTIAALAKVEGFTGDGDSNQAALAAKSLSHISPELEKELNAVVALAQPAIESARRTRALITVFSESVVNIETATLAAPKLKMMPAAASAAMKDAWSALQTLLLSMQETADTSRLAVGQSLVAMKGLGQSPAAAKLLESNDLFTQAAQTVSAVLDMSSTALVSESVNAFRSASWYPMLISDLDAQSPGSGKTLDDMLSGSLRLIDLADESLRAVTQVTEGTNRAMAGLGMMIGGLNPINVLYPASDGSDSVMPATSEAPAPGSTAAASATIAAEEEGELQFIAPDSAVGRVIGAFDTVAQSNFVQGVGELSSGLAQTAEGVIAVASVGVSTLTALGSALYAYSGFQRSNDDPA
jgi:hypothetical protein